MAKHILITSTDLMMVQFLLPHIENLKNNGYIVDIACSNVGGRIDEVQERTTGVVNKLYVVGTVRSPFSLKNIKGYMDMKKIINENDYDYIWTNEPVIGVVTRLAASKKRRKKQLKVMYMAHGFHFYKGASKVNWILFYTVEWLTSFLTDLLVTINLEDYYRAKKLHAKKVEYIHGIGIDTDRLSKTERTDIRKELGLSGVDFLVLSVGELNNNKNQKIIFKALAETGDNSIHYLLCGKGDERENLEKLAVQLNVSERVHFLGYRKDVVDICTNVDVFAMPSFREGLPVATLEAMYCGLPIINSNIRGLVDITKNEQSGFVCEPNDVKSFTNAIINIKNNQSLKKSAVENNKETVKPFLIEEVKKDIGSAYPSLRAGETAELKGRDLISGLPKTVTITAEEVNEAIAEQIEDIIAAVKEVLEKTPPELASDIMNRGIVMTGGGSLLHGMDILVSERTGLPTYIPDDAISCVAIGTGLALQNIDVLRGSEKKENPILAGILLLVAAVVLIAGSGEYDDVACFLVDLGYGCGDDLLALSLVSVLSDLSLCFTDSLNDYGARRTCRKAAEILGLKLEFEYLADGASLVAELCLLERDLDLGILYLCNDGLLLKDAYVLLIFIDLYANVGVVAVFLLVSRNECCLDLFKHIRLGYASLLFKLVKSSEKFRIHFSLNPFQICVWRN